MITTYDRLFMSGALLQATGGTCNRIKVGCVIAKGGNVLSVGCNDSPEGEPNCIEEGCLINDKGSCVRTIHAEEMAITNCKASLLKGATLYCTIPPCPICAQLIIDVGITKVYYDSWYPKSEVSIKLMEDYGIRVTRLNIS